MKKPAQKPPEGGKYPWQWKMPRQPAPPAEMQTNKDDKLSPEFEEALRAHLDQSGNPLPEGMSTGPSLLQKARKAAEHIPKRSQR